MFCLRLSEEGKILYKKKSYYVANKVSNDLTNFLRLPEKKYRINYRFYKYETSYRDIEDLKRLKKFTSKYNKCILVDTSELMKYIGKNLLELKKLKNYGKKKQDKIFYKSEGDNYFDRNGPRVNKSIFKAISFLKPKPNLNIFEIGCGCGSTLKKINKV